MVWRESGSRADAPGDRTAKGHARSIRLTLAAALSGALQAALALAFPRICAVCDRSLNERERHALCDVCLARLPLLGAPRCARCGYPGTGDCRGCPVLDERVSVARSVCWMSGGSGGEIVHALKYSGWRVLAEPMAERMARLGRSCVEVTHSALVPVPLAPARLRERGYNQSELLAAALSRRWEIPLISDLLVRTRHTTTQTALTRQQRLGNVAGAFTIKSAYRARVRRAHLILVDDVITTGATMNACTAAMFAAGARSVAYVTFGRARAPEAAGDAAT